MKKITFTFLAIISLLGSGFGQAVYNNLAIPANDGATSPNRAPNGTAAYAYQRSIMFIHEWEMLPMNSASITTIKFQYANGTGTMPVAGTFTLWLENTNDTDHLKPNNFTNVTNTMVVAYTGNFTVPQNSGNVTLTLTNPFIYTGNGLYVAWNFQSAGPFSTTAATITSNSTTDWIYYNNSATAAVNTFTAGAIYRPSLLFTAINTASTEVEVSRIQTMGKVSRLESATQPVYVTVANSGTAALNNVSVTLNAIGANAYATTSVISNFAAGAITTLTFANYPTPNNGQSTITATSLLNDQIPLNNSKVTSQNVSCGTVAIPQPTIPVANYLSLAVGNGIITSFVHVTGAAASSISAVSCVIPSFTNAANLGAQVYPVLASAAGVIIAVGNTLTLGAGNLGVVQPLSFASPVALTPNTTYLFGIGTTGTGYFPIGTLSGQNIYSGYYSLPLGGGAPSIIKSGQLSLEATLVFNANAMNIASTTTVGCKNPLPGTVTLTATGGLSNYSWSTGGNTQVINVTPTITTVYSVNATDPVSNCGGTALFTYSVIDIPINASASRTLICKGKTTTLTATGGAATYSWSGIAGTAAVNTVTLNTVGVNTFTVYGVGATLGCKSNSLAVTVSVSACTGISVNGINSGDINIFPNPSANGKSQIIGLTGSNTITVYNLLGQAIISTQTEKETFELDFSNQPNGTYLVKIHDANDNSKIVKIVNQN